MVKYIINRRKTMEDLKIVIAKNISELRRRNSMTQLDLAERLNYSDKAVSKWERGESVPDVIVLKQIADLFGVTVDYLLEEEHSAAVPEPKEHIHLSRKNNRKLITGMSIVLVWLIAVTGFVTLDIVVKDLSMNWMWFVTAVPVSLIVWLVLNCIWFERKMNFCIISLLMWSVIAVAFLVFMMFGINIWLLFLIGIPGQIIIVLWSGIIPVGKLNRKNK